MGLFDFFRIKGTETLDIPKNNVEVWCRDTYVLWAHCNCTDWKYIGGCEKDKISKNDLRYILDRDWGICNWQECLEMIEKLKVNHDEGMEAWDLCRATQLVANSYTADFIDRDILYKHSVELAQVIQRTFSSWDEMAESYLNGYIQWATDVFDDEATERIRNRQEAYKALKNTIDGPYQQPWNLPLY